MGWGNIYRRRLKVFTLALMIYLDYKTVQKRVKWVSKSRRAGIWEKTHERNAKRVLNLMIELEGLWVKLGQYLSTRADVLPEAYIFLLRQLQDSLPPRPLNEVKQTIEKELGKPVDDLFSSFVDVPLATASIAQVHRATLRNGQEVVVKVQHESIKQVILEDLKNAKSIIDWIAWAEPQYDFNPLIDEWCKEAPKELDFNSEAENTRTVSRNLHCKNKHGTSDNQVDVLIPEVILSSEKVLVLEYMEGIRLNDYDSLEAFGVDKQKLVEEITRAYAHQIYVDGFFNGDPHPGNFLVSKEPPHRPILLDFGLTKSISSSMKQALAKMFLASAEVCAYKDGEVIIDTAAGVLGRYDPRPVEPDSLFPVFSATKGVTAGMLHWLVDKGKLTYEESVANIWPDFGTNAKEQIKVHHVLNHTSGLQNAMADAMKDNPFLMCEWDESLKQMAMSIPESEPGCQQQYHYLSFGWLCGGIIEHASGKKFQEVLDEAIVQPLNIRGELYIGTPPGVESRLATLTLDMDDLNKFSVISSRPEIPASLREGNLIQTASSLPVLFNTLNARRAIIPAANGHCSARALARYYAALAAGGIAPLPHSSYSTPPLGSHPHIPKFPTFEKHKKKRCGKAKEIAESDSDKFSNQNSASSRGYSNGRHENGADDGYQVSTKMFTNPKIHDACMGLADYRHLVFPDEKFGLGFRRFDTTEGTLTAFGHSGVGGSTGFCDIEHDFAIAVTVNKMSLGGVTRSIIQLVCSELNIPIPQEFSTVGEKGPDMQLNLGSQVIS